MTPDALLNVWIENSDGNPIDVGDGESLTFKSLQRYSEESVSRWEFEQGFELPPPYKDYLCTVGAADLFIDEFGLGVRLLPLAFLRSYQEQLFLGRHDPWGKILVVGCLTNRGDFPAFRLGSRAADSFAVLAPDIDPDLWLASTDWSSFGAWFERLVYSRGEEDLP